MESAAQIYAKHIRAMLRGGPAKAVTLAEGLRVSQPTVSRAIMKLGDEVIRVGAARNVFYVLRDSSRAELHVPLFKVNEHGYLSRRPCLCPCAETDLSCSTMLSYPNTLMGFRGGYLMFFHRATWVVP